MRVKWQSWNQIEDTINKKEIENEENFSFTSEEGSSLLKYDDGTIDTPFGRFSENSPMRPSKRWNCWICHTSSPLKESHVNSINNTKGIAALRILDPYTFVIGVPKEFFKDSDVKRNIQAKICKRKQPSTDN